ncbi:MAG: hypothetical protein ACTHK4_14565, partial [Mycobacteriales bacterium]
GNFSQTPADPDVYTNGNRAVIDLIHAHTRDDPGLRDALLARPVRHELLEKAGPRQFHPVTPEATARKHRVLRDLLLETVPSEVVDRLGVYPRAIAKALRDDDPDAVRRVDDQGRALGLRAELIGLRARGAVWTIDYRLGLTHDGGPVRFHPVARSDGWMIDEAVLGAAAIDRPDRRDDLTAVDLEVLVTSRRTDEQWHLPVTSAAELRPIAAGGRLGRRHVASELAIAGSATVDLADIGGEQIGFGVWDVMLRADVLGLNRRTRLTVVDESALPGPLPKLRLTSPAAVVKAIVTPKRTLALQVKHPRPKRPT